MLKSNKKMRIITLKKKNLLCYQITFYRKEITYHTFKGHLRSWYIFVIKRYKFKKDYSLPSIICPHIFHYPHLTAMVFHLQKLEKN